MHEHAAFQKTRQLSYYVFPFQFKSLGCPWQFSANKQQKRLNIALKEKRSYEDVIMVDLDLAVAPMHRLCKKAGADRVSEAAAKELAKVMEEIGIKIAKEALDFAMHAGRKTIKAEDIEIAAKKAMGK
jgi:histone H3/H4